ncbi:hypothetical protein KJ966_23935 [bacterium]|nr:hypothetical protein [bacterium]
MEIRFLNRLTHIALGLMALQFNLRPSLRKYLKSSDGWTNFTIGIRTASGSVEQAIVFLNGKVSMLNYVPDNADAIMHFVDDGVLKEIVRMTPNEMLNLVLKNKIILYGNMGYLQAFNYYISLILGKKHPRMLNKAKKQDIDSRKRDYDTGNPNMSKELAARRNYRMKGKQEDPGVRYLDDPYLSVYSLKDYPRIKGLLS